MAVGLFLDHLAERACSPHTLCACGYALQQLFAFLASEQLAWQAFEPADAFGLRPATINRDLVSIKCYFGWAVDVGLITRDTSRVVKLIPRTPQPPRHLTDREEEALMAAVSQHGNLRDRTLLVVALHTGLRAEELCGLKPEHVHLGRRNGHVSIYGKRNKYREVPLNSTARDALTTYLKTLPDGATYLFPSRKRADSSAGVGRSVNVRWSTS